MNDWPIFFLGFTAQLLFTCRFLFQWFASEKAKKVVTPSLFWKLSLSGSFLLLIYGLLRNDLPIILGQTLIFGIYIRNLQLQGEWKSVPKFFRLLIGLLPLPFLYFAFSSSSSPNFLFSNPEIPFWLLILGLSGQAIFSFRFVVQWLYSEKIKISVLPLPFWILSVCGSLLILLYAIFRKDPVLFLGHLTGSIIYLRNINLSRSGYVSG